MKWELSDAYTAYNSLRCFADISKKLQKGYHFWQFKDYDSRRRHENKINDPIFSFAFRVLSVEEPDSEVEAGDQNFVSFDSGNIHIK